MNHLLVETSMFVMCPAMLHPFVYVYPLGVVKYLPANIFLLIMGFSGYFASSIFDCIVAMNLERYFAMKNFENYSKIPVAVFWCLHATSLGTLMFATAVALYKPLYANFVIPPDDVNNFIEANLIGLDKIIDTSKLVVFYSSKNFVIPIIPLLWVIFGTIRVNIALITFIIYARLSKILPTMTKYFM
uniref:Uncharacterized protein n=1 Tax=Panagrolaimus davidi TaxID=227884 RepID=A0A914QI92_9BILA